MVGLRTIGLAVALVVGISFFTTSSVCFAGDLEIANQVASGVEKYLPPAASGHRIEDGQLTYAYVLAVVGFVLLVALVMAAIWFGLVVAIFAVVAISIGALCYGLQQGIITTWEQLGTALMYLAIANAIVLIPLRALLPRRDSEYSAQ